MTAFKTWWNYREGKEITIVLSVLIIFISSVVWGWDSEEKDPDVCTNLCIIDKNGIPRYEKWFQDHPEDLPDGIRG